MNEDLQSLSLCWRTHTRVGSSKQVDLFTFPLLRFADLSGFSELSQIRDVFQCVLLWCSDAFLEENDVRLLLLHRLLSILGSHHPPPTTKGWLTLQLPERCFVCIQQL